MIILGILFLMIPWLCLIFLFCLIDKEAEEEAEAKYQAKYMRERKEE